MTPLDDRFICHSDGLCARSNRQNAGAMNSSKRVLRDNLTNQPPLATPPGYRKLRQMTGRMSVVGDQGGADTSYLPKRTAEVCSEMQCAKDILHWTVRESQGRGKTDG